VTDAAVHDSQALAGLRAPLKILPSRPKVAKASKAPKKAA